MLKLSVVVPIYNEEANIRIFWQKLRAVIEPLEISFQLIFVNDGSQDASLKIIRELASEDQRIRFVNFTRNFGHQSALTAGVDVAVSEMILTMDGDLQDPPELIPAMIEQYNAGFELVVARRTNYRADHWLKRMASKAYYPILHRYRNIRIPQNVGDFRLISCNVQAQLKGMRERSRYLRGMIAWLGYPAAYVDYERPDRKHGKAGYRLSDLFRLGMDGILNFSLLPLKLGLFLGIISILAGLGLLFYMMLDSLINETVYGMYKYLLDFIFILVGILFILLWILGEYIGRIFREVKGRPLYVIAEKNVHDEDSAA